MPGIDPDAGKDWRQEEKGMTEDETVGWHHQVNGQEFEHAPGAGDGQGNLACCSRWGHKGWTWLSDWTELMEYYIIKHLEFLCKIIVLCLLLHTSKNLMTIILDLLHLQLFGIKLNFRSSFIISLRFYFTTKTWNNAPMSIMYLKIITISDTTPLNRKGNSTILNCFVNFSFQSFCDTYQNARISFGM